MTSCLNAQGAAARNASLDVLKLVLAVLVVLLHCDFLYETGSPVAFFLHDGLFRVAVPTFFVINGYFLEPHLQQFPLGWISRMVGLYLIWTVLYLPFILSGNTILPSSPLECFVFGYFQLWYVNAVIGAAVLLWLLTLRRLGAVPSRVVPLLAGICFATGVGLQYAAVYGWFPGSPIAWLVGHYWAYRNFLFFGFPFLALGYLIARHEAMTGRVLRPSLPLLGLSFALLIVEWAIKFANSPLRNQMDMSASIAVVAPTLFLWVKGRPILANGRALSKVGSVIYFGHVAVFQLVDMFVQLPATARGLVAIAGALLLSPVLFWLNRRVPVL